MTDENRTERRSQIEAAAFDVLAEKGYRRTSMLQIAKKAQASNQTLYAWYKNKQNLFKTIIEENGRSVRSLLEDALRKNDDPLLTLKSLGPTLLRYTTGRHAIIINRAAVADAADTGILASAVDEVGRGIVYPLICSLMEQLKESGRFKKESDAVDIADTYVSLLFGEAQMRQALGSIGPFDENEINRRALRAFELTCRLYTAKQTND